MTGFTHFHLSGFFIDHGIAFDVVGLSAQFGNQAIDAGVELGAVLRRAGNNQWGTRLINEDGIHLIHNGVIQPALNAIFRAQRHVVAQVIETVFVVGAVGDVGAIGFSFISGWL